MNVVSTRLSPPNSMVVIADHKSGNAPTAMPTSRIAATTACIVVGCLAEMDGQIEIIMGAAPEIDPGYRPGFEGLLEMPNLVVCVWTIEWDKVLEVRAPATSTRVRVWGNHPTEPDRIMVSLEGAI